MFDLDISKMVLVSVVALIVVGPKELPQVLRALGQGLSRLRTLQFSMRQVMLDFMKEADLDGTDRNLTSLEKEFRSSISSNPATAMRGSLPAQSGATLLASASKVEAPHYASPEMMAYLSPSSESLPNIDPRIEMGDGTTARTNDVVMPSSLYDFDDNACRVQRRAQRDVAG